MVTTSGFPKCGNHALVKAVQLLGYPCSIEHFPYTGSIGHHLFIKRDPRNIICSWLRFTGNPVTPGMFITYFRKFQMESLVDEMAPYEGWLSDPETMVVSYEDLIRDSTEMQKIAAYLNTEYIAGSFEELEGLTSTWFAEHSDYNKVWTPEVQAVWNAEGGPELLTRWGY